MLSEVSFLAPSLNWWCNDSELGSLALAIWIDITDNLVSMHVVACYLPEHSLVFIHSLHGLPQLRFRNPFYADVIASTKIRPSTFERMISELLNLAGYQMSLVKILQRRDPPNKKRSTAKKRSALYCTKVNLKKCPHSPRPLPPARSGKGPAPIRSLT